jgi:tellurite resistance protein
MSESHYLSVIRVWAALAWADDVVVEAEAAALRRLIERAPMLSASERDAAYGFLSHKVDLDVGQLSGLSHEMRKGVYRSAVQLAAIDREFAPAERRFLDRLRDGLQLTEAEALVIESDVPLSSI